MNLETNRLILNRFNETDAEKVALLAGDIRVVEMTAAIPYPYETSMAVSWIQNHQRELEEESNSIYAIRLKITGELIGCINLAISPKHKRGVLGYWIGHDFWGNGYCTEALLEIIKFGFEEKKLNRIWAQHKTINIASGRVMEKAGMKHEGIMREHYKQGDRFLDMSTKSILFGEYRGTL